jgi:hypothetical protein
VIDNTHGILIMENIGYNTSGHCFALTSGSERGVSIQRNLGASTRTLEHEDSATFFIVNATDIIIKDNVAAGSEGKGFSISYQSDSSMEWTMNRAHSNQLGGMIFKMDFSIQTVSNATALIRDIQSYRNLGPGVSIDIASGATSLTIESSVLADNRGGMVVTGGCPAGKLMFRNTTLYGQSRSLQLVDSGSSSLPLCRNGIVYSGVDVPSCTTVEIQGVTAIGFSPSDGIDGGHCVSHIFKGVSSRYMEHGVTVDGENDSSNIFSGTKSQSFNIDF